MLNMFSSLSNTSVILKFGKCYLICVFLIDEFKNQLIAQPNNAPNRTLGLVPHIANS